jgi:hypothetical protein
MNAVITRTEQTNEYQVRSMSAPEPSSASFRVMNGVAALLAAAVGTLFFFVIIGVFGLPASVVALVLFLIIALGLFGRRQPEEQRQ